MKKNRGKLILIVATFALAIYFLFPTYQAYHYDRQLASRNGEDSLKYLQDNENSIRDARSKRIKLGLDLQGGMRVVLEVNLVKMLEQIAKNKDDQFTEIITSVAREAQTTDENIITVFQKTFEAKGVRLSRYYGSLREDNDQILKRLQSETDKAVDRAMEIELQWKTIYNNIKNPYNPLGSII